MTCAEFLERYTDFRDGLITVPKEARRFERHMAQCASCRNYDATVQMGIQTLQTTDLVVPSPDFRKKLDARLRREARRTIPMFPARIGIVAALFIVVVLALIAVEGVRRREVAVAPMLPPVPFPKPVAQAGVPFVSFQDPRASVVISNPNPYGTALVEPVSARR
jgi:anti-sigma factor RsiW